MIVKKILILCALGLLSFAGLRAQSVAIGESEFTPNESAILDIQSSNKGVLIPRISLLNQSSSSPIVNPETSLLIYNTATIDDVYPGYYYWDGIQWQRLLDIEESNDWRIEGNAETVNGTNYIGSIDDNYLELISNDTTRFILNKDGYLKINNSKKSVYIGIEAGENSNSVDSLNIFIGHLSGKYHNEGSNNIAIGDSAMTNATSGNNNIAIGNNSYNIPSIGSNNIAIGSYSQVNNHNGNNNIAIGDYTLKTNINGNGLIAIGYNSLNKVQYGEDIYPPENVIAIGANSLVNSDYLSNIISIGYNTMKNSSEVSKVIAIGSQSMQNTDPYYHIHHGYPVELYTIAISGIRRTINPRSTANNIAISSLYELQNGKYNIGIGGLQQSDTSFYNTAVGCGMLCTSNGMHNIGVGIDNTSYSPSFPKIIGNNNVFLCSYELFSEIICEDNTLIVGSQETTYSLKLKDTILNNVLIHATAESAYLSNSSNDCTITIFGGTSKANDCINITTSSTISGIRNIAIGDKCNRRDNYNFDNISLGNKCLYNNLNTYKNIAIGNYSLYSQVINDSASWRNTYNIAIGDSSLFFNLSDSGIDGYMNIAIGHLTLIDNISGNNNIGLGFQSLSNNLESSNIAIGSSALLNNTNGIRNTAIGNESQLNNISGSNNISLGQSSLYSNTTGYDNIATGHNNLFFNTSGYNNTSIGSYSLFNNSTGYKNVSLGYYSLYNNTTGYTNISIGRNSLYNNKSISGMVAIGSYTLYSQSFDLSNWDANNLAIGNMALYQNQPTNYTEGINNTAVGSISLFSNTIGHSNTAIGYSGLKDNTTGNSNTAIGNNSLENNQDGNNNLAIGYQSSFSAVTKDNNVAIGSQANKYNTNGENNTCIGANAGRIAHSLTKNSTFIGYYASAINSTVPYNYSTAIGQNSYVSANQQIRFGNDPANPALSIGGPVSWTTISDGRIKTNIKENIPGIEFIRKLRPVTYNIDYTAIMNSKDGINNEYEPNYKPVRCSGFIAQDVEIAANECNYNFKAVDAPKNQYDFYSLRYSLFVVPLVQATKEKQKIIEEQRNQIQNQSQQIIELQNQIIEKQKTLDNIIKQNEQLIISAKKDKVK